MGDGVAYSKTSEANGNLTPQEVGVLPSAREWSQSLLPQSKEGKLFLEDHDQAERNGSILIQGTPFLPKAVRMLHALTHMDKTGVVPAIDIVSLNPHP